MLDHIGFGIKDKEKIEGEAMRENTGTCDIFHWCQEREIESQYIYVFPFAKIDENICIFLGK